MANRPRDVVTPKVAMKKVGTTANTVIGNRYGSRFPRWSLRAPIHGPRKMTTSMAASSAMARARSPGSSNRWKNPGRSAALSVSHCAKYSDPTPRAKIVLARS